MAIPAKLNVVCFGAFEFNFASRELRKGGMRVRLEGQPLTILELLLERPEQLVTREELQKRLWPEDTFVDFEHSLNAAVKRLRAALSDSADQPRYIETQARRGYRFIAPLKDVGASADAVAVASPGSVRGAPSGRRWWVNAAFAMCLVGLLGWGWHRWLNRQLPAPIQVIRSLAVLPLENLSGDPSQEYFADGITDEFITELARIPTLRVVSRTSAMQEKHARKPLRQIGRELNVDAVVEGSVTRSGDRVRITAQLIDVRNDKHLWAQSFEGPMSDVFSLEDSAAREIASQTKVVLTPAARTNVSDSRRIDPAAHDAYLRGAYFLQKRELDMSVAYFQKATSIDPGYALAFAGLADALHIKWASGGSADVMPAAVAAAKQAIQLDPNCGEAYAALGSIETNYEWNWAEAERNLERGIVLSPNSSGAEQKFAIYLDAVNRPEEALTHMRRAQELDPMSFLMNRHLGSTLYYARRYDEALYYLQQAREMEPGKIGLVDNWASWTYEKKGMHDEAVNADLSSLSDGRPKINIDDLRSIYKRDGWKAYWRARIVATQPYANEQCVPWDLGISYLRIGDRELAFSQLNKAAGQKCIWIGRMKVDPLMDDIRTDKRYNDLLRRVYSHE
jgi:TolB-like protein/DNA-binding winged helix-turn-helix (wHTH) protein/Flp pilus assembly protein TadD